MRLARLTHASLYFLVVAIVFLGWAAANHRGWTVMLPGVIPLPPLAAKVADWAHAAGNVHNTLVHALRALIVLHIAGALSYKFVRRDDVPGRMLS